MSLEDVLEAKLDQCLIHLEALNDLLRERDFSEILETSNDTVLLTL